jgi:hypothetical protein
MRACGWVGIAVLSIGVTIALLSSITDTFVNMPWQRVVAIRAERQVRMPAPAEGRKIPTFAQTRR